MRAYFTFLWRCFRLSFVGNARYHLWMLALTVISLIGLNAYCKQLVGGLATTGMTDQVSWGLYIANFTFLVGLAAAAVMMVIPVYVFRNRALHDLVIFGELMAVAVIVMCLMFVTVDLGRPDRALNLARRFNFPGSMLTWDVIVLNVYLVLNLHLCGYLIYCAYRKRRPGWWFYIPFVFTGIISALSIHTVTAFLYVGLGGRPFWNTAIIAPRFLASAFAAGPAFMILTVQIIRWATGFKVTPGSILMLRRIVTVTLTINMFLLGCELFTEFYTDSTHVVSAQYLFFGLHGHNALVPWIWSAIALNTIALLILYLPLSRNTIALNIACVFMFVGIWIEKGMGLIVPGFIPSPIGEIVEYTPTMNETFVCLGIWAFGLLIYTIFVRVTVPVITGKLTVHGYDDAPAGEVQSDDGGEAQLALSDA